MLELDRIRAASRHFLDLRGLVLVPFGALGLATALLRSIGRDGGPAGASDAPADEWLWMGSVAATIAAVAGVLAWYRRRYGRVTPPTAYRWAAVPLLLVIWVLLLKLDRLGMPLHTTFLFLAVLFATPLLPRYGGRSHYLLLVGGCLLLAFLPRMQLSSRDALTLTDLVLGTGLIVCGILDHQMLTRLMSGPPAEPKGATHVQGV